MDGPTVTMCMGYTHADLAIMPGTYVARQVGDFIRANLTEYQTMFNKRTFRTEYTVTGKYVSWDASSGILHVPIGFATQIKNIIENTGGKVIEKRFADYPLRKIDLSVLPQWSDQEHQVELIKKCSSTTPGIKGLAMQTGKGKTYAAIRTICNLGYAAVVIAPGLADQWIQSFEKFTGERDEIYKIQEFKSLSMLMSSDWKPKVFVCSIQTMQLYAKGRDNYKLLPYSYPEFFKHYGIGVKVVDECHLNFHATVKMDLLTNVPHNLYCSATFGQTNKYAAKIFDVVYPKEIRYGEDAYDKYVEVYWYNFSGEVSEKKCVRQRGYMHVRYEYELLKKKNKFDNHVDTIICPMINMHYIANRTSEGEKCLIFCSSIEFVKALVTRLREKYPALRVNEYIGSTEMDVLDKTDIIVSTAGKAGTGLDIKGLICAINTISIRASILTAQMLGRLRRINGKPLIYVDRCDTSMSSHMRHAQQRKLELRSMCKSYHEYNGFHDQQGVHITN